jgi:DNA-directed RNA polymerase specialized sigma24 family protein
MDKVARNRTKKSWRSAKRRCEDPTAVQFAYYGGRGITMCPEWSENFETFLRDMGERPEGLTLERIDPDGDYEPANCRWATRQEQSRNRRNTIWVAAGGKSLTLKEYAAFRGVPYKSVHIRVSRDGATPEEAADELARYQERGFPSRVYVLDGGKRMPLRQMAERHGVPYGILHYHYRRRGLPLDEALALAKVSKAVR